MIAFSSGMLGSTVSQVGVRPPPRHRHGALASCSDRSASGARAARGRAARPAASSTPAERHRDDRRLEHLRQPAAGERRVRDRLLALLLDRLAELVDVLEQPPRLVLLRLEPRQPRKPPPVVARVDDCGRIAQPVPAVDRLELELVDVEAALVQPAEPVRSSDESLTVNSSSPVSSSQSRSYARRTSAPSSTGSSSPSSPTSASRSSSSPVMFSSAISRSCSRRPALSSSCRSPVSRSTRYATSEPASRAEERVRERAVAPEEPGQVEAHEQLGERVAQARRGCRRPACARARAGRAASTRGSASAARPRARAGGRCRRPRRAGSASCRERSQELVLTVRELVRQLLERVEACRRTRRSARRAGRRLGRRPRAARFPVVERLVPGQVEEVRAARLAGRAGSGGPSP